MRLRKKIMSRSFRLQLALGLCMLSMQAHAQLFSPNASGLIESFRNPASGIDISASAALVNLKAGKPHALDQLNKLAQQNDASAQNIMGWVYDNGQYGVNTNPALAYSYFAASAKQGNLVAKYNLGVLLMTGRGATENKAAAYAYFVEAANQSAVPRACARAALMADAFDPNRKMEFITCAYRGGSSLGYFLLAKSEFDLGNYVKARGLFEEAADHMDPNSPWFLAKIYAGITGIQPNKPYSAAWWIIGAHLNRGASQMNATNLDGLKLSPEERNQAGAIAKNWITAHHLAKPTNYGATILTPTD